MPTNEDDAEERGEDRGDDRGEEVDKERGDEEVTEEAEGGGREMLKGGTGRLLSSCLCRSFGAKQRKRRYSGRMSEISSSC